MLRIAVAAGDFSDAVMTEGLNVLAVARARIASLLEALDDPPDPTQDVLDTLAELGPEIQQWSAAIGAAQEAYDRLAVATKLLDESYGENRQSPALVDLCNDVVSDSTKLLNSLKEFGEILFGEAVRP